jgi:hypothetical protein
MRVTRKPGSTTVIGGTNFCQLVFKDVSTITLARKNGTAVIINGETCVLPVAGDDCAVASNLISATGTDVGSAPAVNTNYYAYRSNSAASYAPNAVRLSATAPTMVNGVSLLGAAGNALDWLYVGFVRVNGSTQFNLVTSHYNPYTAVQIITQTGTTDHVPPPGWVACDIVAVGAGGSGGGAAGYDTQAGGGGGGGGGGWTRRRIVPSQVATTLRCVVPASATGGAGGVGADGSDGANGGDCTVLDGAAGLKFCLGQGGNKGLKGTSAAGGGKGNGGTFAEGFGGNGGDGHASAAGGVGANVIGQINGGTGGGGGAGHTAGAGNTASGGTGGIDYCQYRSAAADTNGVAGTVGPGTGGGGGTSHQDAVGHAGGSGGLGGGGGGGGGAGSAAAGGGRGGDSGQGLAVLTWIF